jgi:hypothetical protein
MRRSIRGAQVLLAVLIAISMLGIGYGSYVIAGAFEGGENPSRRLDSGPQGQAGTIDVSSPPEAVPSTPEVRGSFRLMPQDYVSPAADFPTGAATGEGEDLVAIPAAVLASSVDLFIPRFLPAGYTGQGARAQLDGEKINAYELSYRGARGLSLTVAVLETVKLPFDIPRPAYSGAGGAELTLGKVADREAALYALAPGTPAGEARIIIADGDHMILVVGHVDGSSAPGAILFEDLVKVAESVFEPPPDSNGPESGTLSFSIDLDPSLNGVQATRTIAIGSSLNVEIVVATSGLPWEGYQVVMSYDDVVLDRVVPNPDVSWISAPIEGVRGGNVFAFTTAPPLCTPTTHSDSINVLEDDAGLANWAMTCTELALGASHTGQGALVQFTLRCEAVGVALLTLADIGDTFLLDSALNAYNDAQYNATIMCQ